MTRARHPSLLPLDEASTLPKRSGTAGVALLLLWKAGAAVAPTWVLDATALRDVVARLGSDADPRVVLKKTHGERSEAAAHARELVLHAVLPEPLSIALRSLGEDLLAAGSGITVRRSFTVAVADDVELALATARFVVHLDGLEPAVRALWADAFLESTLLSALAAGAKDLSAAILLSPGDLTGAVVQDRDEAPYLRVGSVAERAVFASEVPSVRPHDRVELHVPGALSRSITVEWLDAVARGFCLGLGDELPKGRALAAITPTGVALSSGELLERARGVFPALVARHFPGGGPLARPSSSVLGAYVDAVSGRRRLVALEDEVERTKRLSRARREADVELDLSILPDDSLVASLREPMAALRAIARLHGRVAAEALLVLGALADAASPSLGERAPEVVMSLASSSIWASPAFALSEIASALRDEPSQRSALDRGAVPEGRAGRLWSRFLRDHGDLPRDPLELSSGSLGGDPALALAMLRVVTSAGTSPSAPREVSLGRIARLSRPAVGALRGRASTAFSLLAETSRLLFGVMATLREVAREASARLSRVDATIGPGGAFATALDELLSALKTGDPRLGSVIAWRRAEPARSLPDALACVVGVSPGSGSGRVTVVRDAETVAHIAAGDVLWLDAAAPLWAPLVPLASALILPGATGLSSLAFVARTLGVPAVAVAPSAPPPAGALLRVDGSRGEVTSA